jgi:hypothetical protein
MIKRVRINNFMPQFSRGLRSGEADFQGSVPAFNPAAARNKEIAITKKRSEPDPASCYPFIKFGQNFAIGTRPDAIAF